MKKIIITGVTGQDGSYMSEYCLERGDCEVYGMVRRTAHIHDHNYRHLKENPNFHVVRGDLLDGSSLDQLVQEIQPDYFINFASQCFVGDSWRIPEETFMAGAVGVLKCLESVRKYCPTCRFYNAGSSEQFGDVIYSPQDISHPFRPRSPYGAAKCAAQYLVKVWRESYKLYAVQGILFNHESKRRGEEFVTRKITKGFARIAKAIKEGKEFEPIYLGNIDAKRDWSHAIDFMDAVWRMLNQEEHRPELKDVEAMSPLLKEYVVASGETHTIREFIKVCTDHLGYDCVWDGHGEREFLRFNLEFFNKSHLKSAALVKIDPSFYRPADINILCGNPEAVKKELGWKQTIPFDILVKRMLKSDLYDAGIISISDSEPLGEPNKAETPA